MTWLRLVAFFILLCSGLFSCSEALPEIVDLASDTEWQLSIDDGPWRTIKVPGGGYNSDLQDKPWIDQEEIRDHVTYRRTITIPETGKWKVFKIEFGGVNHGCEVFINDTAVGTHVGPLMPFEMDISDYVIPGSSYELKVISYPQWRYDYKIPHAFIYTEARKHPDTKPDFSGEAGWATKFSYGITRFIKLRILPEVCIKNIFIQPSVHENTLRSDIWVYNHSSEKKNLILSAALTSWNNDHWDYPEFEPVLFSVSAGEVKKITIGPVPWIPGPESYWWPNKPFREEYIPRLHYLTLEIKDKNIIVDRKVQRFGFVEWGEGSYYYTINGVRINMISDGTPEAAMSEYDCYSLSPAFLPPTDTTMGCPETWKRYMRLGICSNRIHQSVPTQYMMDAADELGFMLIPESPIRGCQEQDWSDKGPFLQSVREMALHARNHPSICRYSLLNEGTVEYVPELVDAIYEIDATHPLVFEDNVLNRPARINGQRGHACAMLHYAEYPKPAEIITGMGEYAWHWADRSRWGTVCPGAEGGLEEYIYYGADMRRWDIAYFAGWDFVNYWPNFLEGMTYGEHAWKQSCYYKDREDYIDGWGSPVVVWAKKYFHPYLVMDVGIHKMNGPETDLSRWPQFTESYTAGREIERELEVFNDGLAGNNFTIKWKTTWDAAGGEPISTGEIKNLVIDPGFHRKVKLAFPAPETDIPVRKLYVLINSKLEGKEVFTEDRIYFLVYENR